MSVTPSNLQVIPKIRKEYVLSLLKDGRRVDGRGVADVRPISLVTGYVSRADGSAFVRLGDTTVLVGIKVEPGSPYPDTPNEGVLIVNAEFVPVASPLFEPGPPDENSFELARVIDRSLRESRSIDLQKLVIIPGKKVFVVWADIYILNHSGNLIDASALATMAALLSARMPKAAVSGEHITIERTGELEPLPVRKKVVTATVAKIGGYFVVDPTEEEEGIADVKLSVSFDESGEIVGMQKAGMGYVKLDELEEAFDLCWNAARSYFSVLASQERTA